MAATLILTYHLDPCSCCRFLPFKNILWRSNPVSLTEASPVEDDVERVGELGDTSGLYKNRYKHRTKAVDCVSRADKKKNKGDVPDVPIGGYKRMESEKPEEKGADSAKVKEPKKRRRIGKKERSTTAVEALETITVTVLSVLTTLPVLTICCCRLPTMRSQAHLLR